ncbi:MAG: CPXCG motif-containing cysteine-rich protein [Verrucomicrobium sp.]|nr:CPXCG motif-containing cysteine-rich protein [Verrucomicrobium sp.]
MLVEVQIECPHCGAVFTTVADTSEGDYTTVEDCAVCCRPMELSFSCAEPGRLDGTEVRPL